MTSRERRFTYTDANGAPLFVEVRSEHASGKSCWFERPDGSHEPGWMEKGGVLKVPDNLPDVITAIAAGERIFLVEGPHKVEALREWGLTASSFKRLVSWGLAPFFKGADVVILPDDDDVGRTQAKAAVHALRGVAASVRIVMLYPEAETKRDIVNWKDEGHGKDEFLALVNAAIAEASAELTRLLDSIVTFICRFVVLTAHQAHAIALWIVHTHAFEAAETTLYLIVMSAAKRSGKTRLLEVLELLVARPWLTARVSRAVLVRTIDEEKPTLLLDESDAAFKSDKEYAEALRGVINCGNRRGGKVSVCEPPSNKRRNFYVFCAKAIAGIGRTADTIEDRSAPIELQRRSRSEPVERFRRRDVKLVADQIRKALEQWALEAVPQLKDARPALPDELNDRLQDGWEPLLAIADLAGGEWPARAREAAISLAGAAPPDDAKGVRLLDDLRAIMGKCRTHDCDDDCNESCRHICDSECRPTRFSSSDLCHDLNLLEESPWSDLGAKGLAALLGPFHVHPKQLKIDGKKVRGYERMQFDDCFERYLTPVSCSRNGTDGTTQESQGFAPQNAHGTGAPGTASKNAPNSRGASKVPLVPDKTTPWSPTQQGLGIAATFDEHKEGLDL